jgi:C4-dicarboxylate-binding protein DctP
MTAALRLIRALVAGILLAGSVHAFADASPIVVRFSLIAPDASPRGRAAQRFREVAERLTHGRVRVQVFGDSSLYVARDELEALQLGAVEVVCANLHTFSALGLSDFDAFELPYLFSSYESVHRVTEGPIGAAMLARLREKGIEGLAFWDAGFKQWTANRALRTPQDIRGLAIRTTYSRVSDAELKAVGAVPQSMSYSQVLPSLKSGVLDGTELSLPFVLDGRIDELQRYLTLSSHAYLGSALVVNRRFWEKLPRDIRAALAEAAAEATRVANEATRREEEAALATLRERGHMQVVALTPIERAQWKRAFMPVHREVEKRMAPGTLDAIYRAAGFVPD